MALPPGGHTRSGRVSGVPPSGPSSGTATARAGRTWRACAPPACSTSSQRCCCEARPPRMGSGR
eukprot:1604764-Alexandrium_andersonii.AAC.1